jgi:uncharacterized damage-inducible protein DinB
MRKELNTIIADLNNVLYGEPWYGKALFVLLDEVHPAVVFKKPKRNAHSLIELVYHMITWADFTLKRLQRDKNYDPELEELLDWRKIDALEHTWSKGLKELKSIHEEILSMLREKDDSLLKEKVDFRDYDFGVLLNGLIQHNIYHLGQLAYVKKLLQPE